MDNGADEINIVITPLNKVEDISENRSQCVSTSR